MSPSRRAVKAVAVLTLLSSPLLGQSTRWTVEPRSSLAWWQVDPHYEHLWATTCPADSSWQAGEGRDPGLYVNYKTRPRTVAAGRSDPRIPLFPRFIVKDNCRQSLRGEVTVADTRQWRGVRGVVRVLADSLFTGFGIRDKFGRKYVLETDDYPEITFTIDSLSDVQPGDTIRAVAVGTLVLHGVEQPTRAPLTAWREPGGLRVKAQFFVPALALTKHFQMSLVALGMGVGMRRWKTVHMGVDVLLREN